MSRHQKPFRPRLQDSTAFTLIELLVVIAIIAILAAMLLPALGKNVSNWASHKLGEVRNPSAVCFDMHVGSKSAKNPGGDRY